MLTNLSPIPDIVGWTLLFSKPVSWSSVRPSTIDRFWLVNFKFQVIQLFFHVYLVLPWSNESCPLDTLGLSLFNRSLEFLLLNVVYLLNVPPLHPLLDLASSLPANSSDDDDVLAPRLARVTARRRPLRWRRPEDGLNGTRSFSKSWQFRHYYFYCFLMKCITWALRPIFPVVDLADRDNCWLEDLFTEFGKVPPYNLGLKR